MLRSSAIVLFCLSAASAFRVTPTIVAPAVDRALRLRGGGDAGSLIVSSTALIAFATGTSMYLGTESVTKILWLGLNKFPHDKYIAMCMIGWAVGKLAAVKEGPDATKNYAQLNCLPLALWLLTNFRGGAAVTTSILPGILLAGYIYAGFVE